MEQGKFNTVSNASHVLNFVATNPGGCGFNFDTVAANSDAVRPGEFSPLPSADTINSFVFTAADRVALPPPQHKQPRRRLDLAELPTPSIANSNCLEVGSGLHRLNHVCCASITTPTHPTGAQLTLGPWENGGRRLDEEPPPTKSHRPWRQQARKACRGSDLVHAEF